MSARAEAVKALHARGVRLCRFKRNAEGEKIALDAEGLKGCALEKALAWEGLLGILAGDLGLGTIDQDHGGAEAREALHRLIPNPLHWYETTKEPSKSHSLYLADKDVLSHGFKWLHGEVLGPKNWTIVRDFPGLVKKLSNGAAAHAKLSKADLDRLPRRETWETASATAPDPNYWPNLYERAKNFKEQDWTPGDEGGSGRNETMYELVKVCSYYDDREMAEEIAEWVIEQGHQPTRAARATLASGWNRGQEKSANKSVHIKHAHTPAGLMTALKQVGVGDARLDERAQQMELYLDGKWGSIDDYLVQNLRCVQIPNRCLTNKGDQVQRLLYSTDSLLCYLKALVHDRRCDPFLVWVEGLPPWDQTPRVDGLLTRLFGAPDDALSRWASRYIGVAALQRAYTPGAKLDETPVLVGAQDVGKSSFTKAWFGEDHSHWHGDGADLSKSGKEAAESLDGKVLVELAELDGLRKADITRVKAFLSRQDDGQFRRAFARITVPSPRRCVFVGTANPSELGVLPNDSSGNRRLIPVVLKHEAHVEPVADAERCMWWAECLERYRGGERGNLPRNLKELAAERAEEHRAEDALEHELRDLLVDLDTQTGFTLNELHEMRFGHGTSAPNKPDQSRYAAALRNLGLDKRRMMRHGGRSMLWVGPPPQPTQEPEF